MLIGSSPSLMGIGNIAAKFFAGSIIRLSEEGQRWRVFTAKGATAAIVTERRGRYRLELTTEPATAQRPFCAAHVVRRVQSSTRGTMPNASKNNAGGRQWRAYFAAAAWAKRPNAADTLARRINAGIVDLATAKDATAAARAEFVALFSADVAEFPSHYRADVVADPGREALKLVEDQPIDLVRRLTADLKAERRAIARATSAA